MTNRGSTGTRVERRIRRVFVGKVVGQVWASKKVPTLEGFKLLLVEPLRRAEAGGPPDSPREDLVVVADATIGAGVGEYVVVAYGKAARVCLGRGQDIAAEAAVAGVVDELEVTKGLVTEPELPPGSRREKNQP
jgi:ethanolamine utilization protein EutN